MSDTSFMDEAIQLSREKMMLGSGGPFGAVVVKDNKVVGRGWNKVTSSNDPTAHAEVVAIRDACETLKTFDLSDCVIYTSCEPCPMCLSAVYWARLTKVYYGNDRKDAAAIDFDDEFIYEEVAKGINERKIPMVQIESDKAIKVFHEWKAKSDRVQY